MKKKPVELSYVSNNRRLATALAEPDSPPGRILTAARSVFAEHGKKAATTREIAARADVNIATIHYYWGSKDELWYAVISSVLMHLTELTGGLLDLPADDLPGAIRNIIGRLVDVFADNPDYARLLQHRTIEGVSEGTARELYLPILDIGLEFVKRNKITGLARNFDPALVLFSFQGALRIFFQEKDSVKAIFKEDPGSFSPEFRQQLKDLITSLALFYAGLENRQVAKNAKKRK